MGSLSSSSSRARPQSNNHLICASFCGRDPNPNANLSNWIEFYNPETNSWRRVSSIPGLIENHIIKGFSMVSVGDSIYIIGGRLCHKVAGDDPDDTVEVDLEVLPSVRRYNWRTAMWHRCSPLLVPRFDFACTVNENKIYVAGGQCTIGSAKGISSAEVYDTALDEWAPLPNMTTLRYKCIGVTWQGKIHVVGGFTERGNGDSPGPYNTKRSSAEVYDPCGTMWDLVPRMWDLDIPPNQIVAVEGRLFSSGDCLNIWKGYIESYDGKLNMWEEVYGSHLNNLSPISTTDDATGANWPPIQRRYLTMASIGTHLYFLAGYKLAGEIPRMRSDVHVFDTSSRGARWRNLEPVEEEGEKELCCHCCVIRLV